MTVFTTNFAEEIFTVKYKGTARNSDDFYDNLADRVALGDKNLALQFFRLLDEQRFSPGGRILAWAGRPDAKMSLMNCTTHAITDDSLEAISHAGYCLMRASSRGQGIGIDLSALRPKNSPVDNAAKTSTGAISFMEMLNTMGGTIGQEGRRAAILFSLDVSHPDLLRSDEYDFLNIKKTSGKVENANISVKVSDKFMQAVEDRKKWDLIYSGTSGREKFEYVHSVDAARLFRTLAQSAHSSAEPGILYWDTAKHYSNSDLFGEEWKIVGVNACSEEVLDQDGVCNLGSMNLTKYVIDPFTNTAYFDYSSFINDVTLAVEFLDNVITIELDNGAWITEQQRRSLEYLRRIGLGVMGLADTLAMLGLRYGSDPPTLTFLHTLFQAFRDAAYKKSIDLAIEKGPAKAWTERTATKFSIVNGGFFATLPRSLRNLIFDHGIRNITVTSIAPTGTISNLLGVSSGIEPLFEREYVRMTRMNGHDELIHYTHPGVIESRAVGIPDDIWVTAYEATVEDHLAVLATAQKYIDASISKTVNFPQDALVEDIEDAYMQAWKMGIKGLSVYRQGSRESQVLYTVEDLETNEVETRELCPVCGGRIIHQGGCHECADCGYSLCDL